MEEKVKDYSRKLGINHCEFLEPTRRADIIDQKHAVWYLLRKEGCRLTDIASRFNRKSHASVIYGVNRVKNLMDVNDKKIMAIMKLLTCQ